MRRISMAIALASAVVATGCGGSVSPAGSTGDKGVGDGTFRVTVQNGQGQAGTVLQIKDGYVTSTPAGIDCGGAAHTACDFDFPVGQAVTLTANADAGKVVLIWAGDCNGIGSTCSLPAGDAPRYVVIQFGAAGERTVHPNFTDPAVHGAEVAAQTFTCSACHGQELTGVGIAPSCVGCHDAAFAAAVKAVNETPKKDVETCATCHASGSYAAASKHAETNVVTASAGPVSVAANTTDLEFTVNVKVDGVNSNAFANNATKATWRGYRHQYKASLATGTVIAPYERVTLTLNGTTAGAAYTVAAPVNGDYLVTIVGGVAAAAGNAQRFLVTLTTSDDPATSLVATAVTNYAGANARDLVGSAACVNCHDLQVFNHKEPSGEWHHGANPYGVEACTVCHVRSTSTSRSAGGDRLTAYVHGVHNSHEMPARDITVASLDPDGSGPLAAITGPFTTTKPDGVYARNDSVRFVTGSTSAIEVSSPFSIGFPGYMVNCASCHDTQARLDAIMAKPVSASTCLSCHDSWVGFPTFNPADTARYDATLAATHTAIALPAAGTATANPCASCHDGVTAFATVGDVHQVRVTERNGLVYRGQDQSIAQGNKFLLEVTGVDTTTTAGKLIVTWTAKVDGTTVNPCNTDIAAGPVFMGLAANAATGQSASNMSILQAYAQGNDWVNPGNSTTSPGQPGSAPTLTINADTTVNGATQCSSNVATSYVTAVASNLTVTKGQVGLQGKPQITFTDAAATPVYTRVIQVRAESPVREFVVADGSAPAAGELRRQIVSNDKCLACHPGSLYQHGGNRIDSVSLCVMCHNPAANERNNRDNMGVPLASTYDGKVGQTYDLRTMIHAIHSAGETGVPLVFYRTNGLYAFGSQAAIDNLAATKAWPGAGCFPVAGSTKSNSAQGATSTGAQCGSDLTTGPTIPTKKNHNEIVVHYPRHLNDCSACHVGGSEYGFPNGTKAMAVTVDSGASAPIQTDDVLRGANAQSCMTCHQTSDAVRQAELNGHANGFGWTPSIFTGPPAGREWLILQATP